MNCSTQNFTLNDSNLLNFVLDIKAKDIDSLAKLIILTLKKKDFSVNINTSDDSDTYLKSINDLIEVIRLKLVEKNNVEEKLMGSDYMILTRKLREALLPPVKTKVEINIEAVIPNVGLLSLKKVEALRFGDVLQTIYGDDLIIRQYREDQFKNHLLIRTIIDTNKENVITGTSNLNKNLMEFKKELYEILKNFILSLRIGPEGKSFNKELIARSYYFDGNKTSTVDNIYAIMYNYIRYLKKTNQLENLIKEGWLNKNNGKNSLFFDALNAYVTLQFFDESIKKAFGEYISINRDYDEPVDTDENGNIVYKYTLSTGNVHMNKDWTASEYQNAIDNISGFTDILLTAIPKIYYDSDTAASKLERALNQNLTTIFLVNAFINLKEAINLNSSSTLDQLRNTLNQTLDTPSKWIEVFKELFKNKTTINTLLKTNHLNGYKAITDFDIDVLYSFYRAALDPTNRKSYYRIEKKHYKEWGVQNRYPIVGSLLGLLNSTAQMSYLELVWDRYADVPGYKIRVKRKANTNHSMYEVINALNKKTYTRTDKERMLSTYLLKTENAESKITVTFNVNNVDTPIVIEVRDGDHILIKNTTGKFLAPLEGVFDEKGKLYISLQTPLDREKLLGSNLNTSQKTFMTILKFIDDMLETTFSMDSDGLLELNQFIKLGGSFFDLYKAAVRTLRLIDIYNGIEKNPDFLKTQIVKYLNESKIYQNPFYENENDLKSFLKTEKSSLYLTTVNASDKWISTLVNARMILNGSVSKSVTKNINNDNVPNSSPTYLAAELPYYMRSAIYTGSSSSKLLFTLNEGNMKAIRGVIVDEDILLEDGTKKQIKDMTASELFYHSIMDKFYTSYFTSADKTVIILSTTFSDKTKFVGQIISLSDLNIRDPFKRGIGDECTNKLYDTVGEYYKEIWKNVLDDYEKIFGTRNITEIEHHLNEFSKELKFIEYANREGINVTVYKDTHYRIISDKEGNKKLSINELLYTYATDTFASISNLRNRLAKERINFVNELIKNRVNFYITRDPYNNIDYLTPIGQFIINHAGRNSDLYIKDWVHGNKLIYAKILDRNKEIPVIDSLLIKQGLKIILNPFLESYFSIDTLLSNNLRFALTGSEINHKIKEGYNIDEFLRKDSYRIYTNFGFNSSTSAVEALEILKRIINDETDSRRNEAIRAYDAIINDLIYKRESAGQLAQLKRNVIITATMRHYLQDLIEGVADEMEVACIDDVKAFVLNFDGSSCYDKKSGLYKSADIDAHDGYGHIHPIMSILENKSLQDNEVGDMKKNIFHDYDHKFGTATLFKYAAGAMTNAVMKDSELAPISLRRMFKKMSDRRWSKRYADGRVQWLLAKENESGEVDLTTCGYKNEDNSELDFKIDILEEKLMYYRDRDGNYKQIFDFGKDENDYYTIEQNVGVNGIEDRSEKVKIYHYFNNNGEHIKSETLLNKFDENGNEILHTIDSIYELWTVMGGLESMELGLNGLQESEASLYATAAFVNFVANKKSTEVSDEINLTNYDQPLKRSFIAYLINNSAVKNGAGNINPSSSYYDDTPLRTITVKTKGHGVQLDADHTADEAIMTEFSLVITSLDSGSNIHNYVRQIYNVLGTVALKLSNIEIEAVEEFKNTGNKSRIVDLIGRTIMKNIKDGLKGVIRAIMDSVKEEFNMNADHVDDIFKIPFSDPNIYSQILSTFVSIINKKSIKRQYPGSGMVMLPGYDILTVFDYDGQIYQYGDLLKLARTKVPKEIRDSIKAIDNSDYNRKLVQELLKIEQRKHRIDSRFDWINPADRVNIYILNNDNKRIFISDILLDTTDDYYSFKSANNRKFLVKKLTGYDITSTNDKSVYIGKKEGSSFMYSVDKDGIITILNHKNVADIQLIESLLNGNILYQKNITKPRNLAPVKILWTMPNGTIMNIFDHWAIKALYEYGVRDQEMIQKAFELLHEGKYLEGYYDVNKKLFILVGDLINVTNIINTEAECIVPNIFLSKFNLDSKLSLIDILNDPYIFNDIDHRVITSNNFDLAFTKNNGRNVYITFNPIKNDDNSYSSSLIEWEDTRIEDLNEGDIKQRIYAVNKDNIDLFEIGRKIINNDVIWNDDVEYKGRKGAYTDKSGNIKEDLSLYTRYTDKDTGKVKILETVMFVEKRRVTERQGKKTNRYTLYNINKNALQSVYFSGDPKYTIDDFIGKLLSNIYNSDDFNGIQLNASGIPTTSARLLYNALKTFANNQHYNNNLYELIIGKRNNGLRNLLKLAEKSTDDIFKIDSDHGKIVTKYFNNLRKEIRASFLKSLYFTASRIPALTLQSFMKMKAVAFTRGNVTHTYVSHFLTWLLGSDYDIDKAYMMGLSFNGMGQYVGWSNLFDNSTLETIQASEYLPMPSGTEFIFDEKEGTDVNEYAKKIYLYDLQIRLLNTELGIEVDLKKRSRELRKAIKDEKKEEVKIKLNQELKDVELKLQEMVDTSNHESLVNDYKAKSIRVYADLLTYLNDNNISKIKWNIEENNPVNFLNKLLTHERTKIPKHMLEAASKNFISSHILNTVLHLTNMVAAYTPIEMGDFRSAASFSPKGDNSKSMTLMNPLVKYLMQRANMLGKNVIGIAATGIKASFTWHYYLNDILQNNLENSKKELIERARFKFQTSRILGRSLNNILSKEIRSLPDINANKINTETLALFFNEDGSINTNRLRAKLTADLMLSQILSAATDNAKELILDKVICNNKLAKCYLFLITLGFDINDVVSFMTSPIIDFIDTITENNVYYGINFSIEDAIKILNGEIPNKFKHRFFSNYDGKAISNKAVNEAFNEDTLNELKNPFRNNDPAYYSFIDFVSELRLIKSLMPKMNDNLKEDLKEFEKILEGSEEFSKFGRLLSINQGIQGEEKKFKGYLNFIKSIVTDREKALGLINKYGKVVITDEDLIAAGYNPDLVGKFDPVKWLSDEDYKLQIRKYYGNKLKLCIPIFDIIEEIPLYKAAYTLVDAVNVINTAISLKTKVHDIILEHYDSRFWSDNFLNNLLHSIQAKFIELFFYNNGIKLPYKAGTTIFNKEFDDIKTTEDSFLTFDSITSLASFKSIFETYIIPKLKEGILVNVEDDKITVDGKEYTVIEGEVNIEGKKYRVKDGKIKINDKEYTILENKRIIELDINEDISKNRFIKELVEGSDRNMPLYKANVDMLNYDLTPEGLMKMLNYIKGIQALLKYTMNGISLSDWFMLYNIYVNHNNYGSSRLTTLFGQFIDSRGNSPKLREYLQFVGGLDYFGSAQYNKRSNIEEILIETGSGDSFTININDLFMMSAVSVSHTNGKSDPVYRVNTEDNSQFYKRNRDGSYSPIKNKFFSDSQRDETNFNRQTNIDNYATVGGIAQQELIAMIENLNALDYNTILALTLLLQTGFLEILKICK